MPKGAALRGTEKVNAMQYLFYFLSLLSIASAQMVAAEGSVNRQPAHQYPEQVLQSFNQECRSTSLSEGLGEAEAEKLCGCAINEFESQYSIEEFQQLTATATTDKQAETALIEVGQFCFEQILYAE